MYIAEITNVYKCLSKKRNKFFSTTKKKIIFFYKENFINSFINFLKAFKFNQGGKDIEVREYILSYIKGKRHNLLIYLFFMYFMLPHRKLYCDVDLQIFLKTINHELFKRHYD